VQAGFGTTELEVRLSLPSAFWVATVNVYLTPFVSPVNFALVAVAGRF
jgi:hypothetical protein